VVDLFGVANADARQLKLAAVVVALEYLAPDLAPGAR
jgi:hypothetical protein